MMMMTNDRYKLAALKAMLRSLEEDGSAALAARDLRFYLSPDEYEAYRQSRSNHCSTTSEGQQSLSSDGEDYWQQAQALCKRSTLFMSKIQRQNLLDEAAELAEEFSALPANDMGQFRIAEIGDALYGAADRLECVLYILRPQSEIFDLGGDPINILQRNALNGAIWRIEDVNEVEEPSAAIPAMPGVAQRLRALAARLNR